MRVLAPPPRINKNNYEASPSSSLQPPSRNIAQIPIEFDFEAAVQDEMRRLEQNFQALASNGGEDEYKKSVSFASAAAAPPQMHTRGGGHNTDSQPMSTPFAAAGAAEINLRNWQREGYPSEFSYAKAMGVLDAPPPERSIHAPPTMQQPSSKLYRSPGTDDLHAPVNHRHSPAYAAADDQPIANNSLMVGGMMNSAEQAAALRKRQQAEYAQQLRSDSSNNLRMDQGMSKHKQQQQQQQPQQQQPQQQQPAPSSYRPSGPSPPHGGGNTSSSSSYPPQKGVGAGAGGSNQPPYSPNRDRGGGGGGGKYSPDRGGGGGGGGGGGKYSPGRAAKWAAAEAEAALILRREEQERLGLGRGEAARHNDLRQPPPQPPQRNDYDPSANNGNYRPGDQRDQRADPRYEQRANSNNAHSNNAHSNNAHSNNAHGERSGPEQRGNGNTSPARARLVTGD